MSPTKKTTQKSPLNFELLKFNRINTQFSVVFCVAHRAVGSFFIAGVRVFYIKFHHVLLRVGVNKFVSCAKWLGFLVSLIMASGQAIESYYFRDPPGGMVFYAFFSDLNPNMGFEFEAVFDHICTTFRDPVQ